MSTLLLRQLLLFVLVGGAQEALDWAVFVGLTSAGLALSAANLLGRACGACLGFWLNGRYTFASAGRPRLDGVHLRRFIIAWLLLTVLSTLLLLAVRHLFDLHAAWLAKPLVEAAMAALGFLIWRHWVYR